MKPAGVHDFKSHGSTNEKKLRFQDRLILEALLLGTSIACMWVLRSSGTLEGTEVINGPGGTNVIITPWRVLRLSVALELECSMYRCCATL